MRSSMFPRMLSQAEAVMSGQPMLPPLQQQMNTLQTSNMASYMQPQRVMQSAGFPRQQLAATGPGNGAYMNVGLQQELQSGLGNGLLGGVLNSSAGAGLGPETTSVKNVWKWNLEEQMSLLRDLVDRYKYISIDCKFPGIVARPIGAFKSTSQYHYQTLRTNVDILQVIQIGLTFSDEFGNHPIGVDTWQFNFKFNRNEDMCSSDGIELLRQSGLDFVKHANEGIDPFVFGGLMISSGLVLNDSMHWITFHSGYDLGYLLSLMLNKEVPVEERAFLKTLTLYFPNIWDVKYITKKFKLSNNSQLSDVAEDFQVRLGVTNSSGINQAGNDALLTKGCYFEIKRILGDGNLGKVKNQLFGLGEGLEGEDNSSISNSGPSSSASANSMVASQPTPTATNAANAFQFGKMGGGL